MEPSRTPIQERLLLLVHLQKNRIKMREMEILALTGASKENADALQGLIDGYRNLLFPGSRAQTDRQKDELEARKRALAEEAQKAFIVKPVDMKKVLEQAKNSTNPHYQQLAGRAFVEHEKERMKQLQKKAQVEQDRAIIKRRLKKRR